MVSSVSRATTAVGYLNMWQAKVILLTNRLFTWRSLFGSFLSFTSLEIFFKLVARVKRHSLYLRVRILTINVPSQRNGNYI